VVSRKPKLIAAGAVLAAGFGVACLFRREGDADPSQVAAATSSTAPSASAHPSITSPLLDGQFSPQPPVPASGAVSSTSNDVSTLPTTASPAAVPPMPPLPGGALDVQSNPSNSGVDVSPITLTAAPQAQIHVIHGGDTLESIAERYLGDARRAWELFDLNRDVLENPHILPLGAELRIPANQAAAGER
jgi:nucleoid-associated protein YgaU